MKIAFFTQNTKIAGIDIFIRNLINNWPHEDDISLISNSNNPGIKYLKKQIKKKFKIEKYNNYFLNKKKNSTKSFYIKTINFIYKIFYFYNFFKKKQYDRILIINGGFPGGENCLSASIAWAYLKPNIKSWHNFHNYVSGDKSFIKKLFSNLRDRLFVNSIKGFISVSKSCCRSVFIRRIFKGKKVHLILNGTELSNGKKTIYLKKKLRLKNKSKIILMLAVYEERKGHRYMMQVMKEVLKSNKNHNLVFFGYGNKNEILALRNYAKKLKINKNIYFFNFYEDSKSLIEQSDLLVVPSLKNESFGYTIIEAFSLKKPVIAHNILGPKEIIKNNFNGYLIKPGEKKIFAKKIIKVLSDRKTNKKIINNGYKSYIRNYTAKKMSQNYAKLVRI